MSREKKDDEKMNATLQKQEKVKRKKSVKQSFRKAVAANGKALERLSKN